MGNKFFQSKWITTGLVIGIGYLLLALVRIQPDFVSVRREITNVSQKISELEREREETERLAEYFQSSAYLEKQARIKLNYKKPGENVVYIYRKTPETQNKSEGTENKAIKKIVESGFYKNLESWWRYLTE